MRHLPAPFRAALAGVLVATGLAAGNVPASPAFYPGVTEAQSLLAHEALRAFHNGETGEARRRLAFLAALETRDSLPPLGRLLHAAMVVIMLERDDTEDSGAVAALREEFAKAASDGLRRCAERAGNAPDPTCLVIEGGLRGYRALLRLETHSPVTVLSEGLGAVALLERALEEDSSIHDAHMGLGLFNMLAASNAPAPVRGMLRAAGRGVGTETGLAHLRRSAYAGQYTSTASQYYLIRFLSPYDDELRREKYAIFAALRAAYPRSARVLFLEAHESLCFHPDSFSRPGAREVFARRLREASEVREPASRRMLELARLQYTLLDSTPPAQFAPDPSFPLGGYAFYPGFVEALRLRHAILRDGPNHPARPERLRELARARAVLLARLREPEPGSTLPARTRAHLAWQVRDALRPGVFLTRSGEGAPSARQEGSADSRSNSAGKSRKPADK